MLCKRFHLDGIAEVLGLFIRLARLPKMKLFNLVPSSVFCLLCLNLANI